MKNTQMLYKDEKIMILLSDTYDNKDKVVSIIPGGNTLATMEYTTAEDQGGQQGYVTTPGFLFPTSFIDNYAILVTADYLNNNSPYEKIIDYSIF